MQDPQETWVRSLGLENPLEEGMATQSSVLACRIPWTEEPGGLQSMRLQKNQIWLSNLACRQGVSIIILPPIYRRKTNLGWLAQGHIDAKRQSKICTHVACFQSCFLIPSAVVQLRKEVHKGREDTRLTIISRVEISCLRLYNPQHRLDWGGRLRKWGTLG